MMMETLHSVFGSLFTGGSQKREAQELYIALVHQSRKPFFYTDCAVPDTLDGRFDLIVLNVWLELARLKGGQGFDKTNYRLSRLLLETLFDDMDRSLREMGVGDMGVGKRVKRMSKAAYGRLDAYTHAAGSRELLAEALRRNVYRGAEVAPEAVRKLVEYVQAFDGIAARK